MKKYVSYDYMFDNALRRIGISPETFEKRLSRHRFGLDRWYKALDNKKEKVAIWYNAIYANT